MLWLSLFEIYGQYNSFSLIEGWLCLPDHWSGLQQPFQFREIYRLGQVQVEPRLRGALQVILQPVAAHGDQAGAGRGWVPSQRRCHLVAVHSGKAEVAEHHLRSEVRQPAPSVLVEGDPVRIAQIVTLRTG